MSFRVAAAAVFVFFIEALVPINTASASDSTFDNGNELANDFNQNDGGSPPTPYVQSATGGVTGGSVLGYLPPSYGVSYTATAVYTPSTYNLSTPGASVSVSMDFFFDGQLTPLAPGANAVRSFRLGILDASTSAFETFPNASAYIDGEYSFTTSQLDLVVRNETNSLISSIEIGAPVSLNANDWYQLNATFTNEGNNQLLYNESFFDLGSSGRANPLLLSTGSWSWENDPMTSLDAAYAGFSVLADGGFSQADNFGVPSTPLPATLPLFATGLA